jgi:hypothetical protein
VDWSERQIALDFCFDRLGKAHGLHHGHDSGLLFSVVISLVGAHVVDFLVISVCGHVVESLQ